MTYVSTRFALQHIGLFDPKAASNLYYSTYLRYEERQPVPVSSFPFPTITLIRAPALATQTVPMLASSVNPVKQPSRRLTPLHTHSFPPTGLHVARFDHRQRSTQT